MMSTPRGCTNLKLRRLSRTVARLYDAEMRPLGLNGAQYALLSHVVRLGPVTPGALAAAMGLDPSTLTRTLRPLQQAGWVLQGPGPDARSQHWVATAEGQALRAKAQPHWRRAQESINRQLGAERVAALHALLDTCADALEGRESPAPG